MWAIMQKFLIQSCGTADIKTLCGQKCEILNNSYSRQDRELQEDFWDCAGRDCRVSICPREDNGAKTLFSPANPAYCRANPCFLREQNGQAVRSEPVCDIGPYLGQINQREFPHFVKGGAASQTRGKSLGLTRLRSLASELCILKMNLRLGLRSM